MEIFATGRQGGKTFRIMEWLNAEPHEDRVLVVHSEAERGRLLDQYDPKGLLGFRQRIYSIGAVDHGRSLFGRKVVVGIDNLDLVLSALFAAPVGLVTTTG